MIQKTCFLWAVIFFGYFHSLAQQYSTVKINTSPAIVETLQHLDLALDHIHSDGISIQADFSRYELQQIKQAGIDFVVIRQDAEKEKLPKLKDYSRDNESCLEDQFAHIVTPENFELGSMKGHLTYQDLLMELDKMFQLFPEIVSKATPIGDFKTEDGRNIHYVKIGSDLQGGKKPTILYTALHHSREPISMTQMIYFMWYLLENYEENSRIRTLIDKIDLYFVPCVNPDGYVYNHLIHPEGGGLWRKNRRPLPDGSFGVDLNRNYGFNWGYDNQGSSNNYLSEVYRGEEAFSEPEVKAIRQLCLEHNFRIALNYHSYGNYLIYPFGYTQSKGPDHTLFEEMSAILTKENRFIYGNGIETVQYLTNGDSDDWMYGESIEKDQIFALTPEIGNSDDGFWPEINRIIPLCKSTLPQNIQAAEFLFNSAFITDLTAPFVQKKNANKWDFKMTKLGFDDGGFQLNLVPLSDNIDFPQASKFYILDAFNFINDHFDYNVHQDIASGETIRFMAEIDNGNVIYDPTPTTRQALSEENAYVMLHMLMGGTQVEGGTGFGLGRDLIVENEIGAKTGTTQNASDGWFMGVTKDLVAGAWVGGFSRSIHFRSWVEGQGGRTALPIYRNFMRAVYEDKTLGYEKGPFIKPSKRLPVELDCYKYKGFQIDPSDSSNVDLDIQDTFEDTDIY